MHIDGGDVAVQHSVPFLQLEGSQQAEEPSLQVLMRELYPLFNQFLHLHSVLLRLSILCWFLLMQEIIEHYRKHGQLSYSVSDTIVASRHQIFEAALKVNAQRCPQGSEPGQSESAEVPVWGRQY